MDSISYLTGNQMNGLTEQLDIIASNLANASTPGYKKMQGKFQSALNQAMGSSDSTNEPQIHLPELAYKQIDTSQGPVRTTGRPLDVAIQGRGFLVVDTLAGERYTRRGRLQVNADGELTDSAGNPFAGSSGSIRIPDGAAQIAIGPNGEVVADGQSLGTLELVDIPDPRSLVPEGSGLYRNDGDSARRAADSRVLQGAVEESNVNTMAELVDLVKVMRHYEIGSRLMKRWDSVQQQLIQSAA